MWTNSPRRRSAIFWSPMTAPCSLLTPDAASPRSLVVRVPEHVTRSHTVKSCVSCFHTSGINFLGKCVMQNFFLLLQVRLCAYVCVCSDTPQIFKDRSLRQFQRRDSGYAGEPWCKTIQQSVIRLLSECKPAKTYSNDALQLGCRNFLTILCNHILVSEHGFALSPVPLWLSSLPPPTNP